MICDYSVLTLQATSPGEEKNEDSREEEIPGDRHIEENMVCPGVCGLLSSPDKCENTIVGNGIPVTLICSMIPRTINILGIEFFQTLLDLLRGSQIVGITSIAKSVQP